MDYPVLETEADFETLQPGSVVLDGEGEAWTWNGRRYHKNGRSQIPYEMTYIATKPLRVIYVPLRMGKETS